MFTQFHSVSLYIHSAILALGLVAFAPIAHADETPQAESPDQPLEELVWHSDYAEAYRQAKQEKKYLLINFVCESCKHAQQQIEKYIADNKSLQDKLQQLVLLKVPVAYEIQIDGSPVNLHGQGAFHEMHNKPGFAIIDLKNEGQPYFGNVVSAFPFTSGKFYSWKPEYLAKIIDLPGGTITQRTMVWAVRVHPERPQSTHGNCDPHLTDAAASHSNNQARMQQQGHHNWSSRFHTISSQANAYDAKEVVAESWPNQTMLDSCIDCVDSWRHSSGHWGAVRRRHRLFGYDIKRGRNGIWYGTGIFAN